MSVLKTLVDADTKARFRRMAKKRSLSESELLRAVALAVTGQDKDSEQPIAPDAENADIDRMTVRMPRFLIDEIKTRAKAKGMAPSRWVASLVQSNLMGLPVMNEAEVIDLRTSNRELAAIGRNLNQIARALNEAPYDTDRIRPETLTELSQVITENREVIHALVRASYRAWQSGTG